MPLGLGLALGLGHNVAATSGGGGGAFTPASISGLDFWLEADPTKLYTDAGTTLVSADGQAVQQANDKSGLGRNVSNITLANRPLYKTDLAKPSLLFDGTDSLISANGLSLVDGSGQHWLAVSLLRSSSSPNFQEPVVITDIGGSTGYVADFYLDTSAHFESRDAAGASQEDTQASFPSATATVLIGTITTAAIEVFIDNVSAASTSISTTRRTNTATLIIGGLSVNFTGRIFGVCHGTGVLSSTDRGNLQTYMAALHP